jgi:Domain of unknown function (DUF4440)
MRGIRFGVGCARTLVLLALAATAAVSPASARGDAEDEEYLRYLKEVLWPKAYFEQNTILLDRILADEFQTIDDEGNWSDKKGEMARVKKGKPSYDSLVFEIKRLDVFANGTAIIAGKGVARGKDGRRAYVMEYESTNVLIKRDGTWKAVASHVSGVKKKYS